MADVVPGYPVILEWDANTEPDVTGYRLYYGTVSADYTETFDAGNVTVATVLVVPGVTYFFAVTAYNAEGLESAFSNEIVFSAPLPPDLLVENIEPPAGSLPGNAVPEITSAARLAGGHFTFTIAAPAGRPLQVEVSSDLNAWACRGMLENPTGAIIVTDTDAARYTRRYYRVTDAPAE